MKGSMNPKTILEYLAGDIKAKTGKSRDRIITRKRNTERGTVNSERIANRECIEYRFHSRGFNEEPHGDLASGRTPPAVALALLDLVRFARCTLYRGGGAITVFKARGRNRATARPR